MQYFEVQTKKLQKMCSKYPSKHFDKAHFKNQNTPLPFGI
jgi:hypothetical protein